MTSIVFFVFEVISCWVEQEDTRLCTNTSNAALFLSVFVILGELVSLISQAVPSVMSQEIALTKERVAAFKLNIKEKLQLTCGIIGGSAALVSLSSLGVAGEPNSSNFIAGMVGLVPFTIIFFIEAWTTVRAHKENSWRVDLGQKVNPLSNIGPSRRIISGDHGEGGISVTELL